MVYEKNTDHSMTVYWLLSINYFVAYYTMTTHCRTHVGSLVGNHYTLSNIWVVTGTLSDSWFVVHWCMKVLTDTEHTYPSTTNRNRQCSIGVSRQSSGSKSCTLTSSCSAGSIPYKVRNYTTILNIIESTSVFVTFSVHMLILQCYTESSVYRLQKIMCCNNNNNYTQLYDT